jgi:transcriptional regulator with XRE-family HTH domain
MVSTQHTPGAFQLARRLRELREREFKRLTQSDLGQALGDDEALSPATISMWENPSSGRLPPPYRLEAYARLFCTPRSFEGGEDGVRMLDVDELTEQEQDRMEELQRELLGLRDSASTHAEVPSSGKARSMWHFPDGSRITLACYRLPPERRRPTPDVGDLNYVRFGDLADLDTLIDIYGAIRAYNPTSRVVIKTVDDLNKNDVTNHLVLIGGLTWATVTPWFSRIFHIPIEAGDPAERGAIVVHDPDGGEREFKYTLANNELIEDVGFFVRGANPSAPRRTLTICGGITTRGVHGAALCFIDWEMRESNDQWLMPRFPDGSTYCIVMRVPVVNGDPLSPDLSRKENRLFEWYDASTGTE